MENQMEYSWAQEKSNSIKESGNMFTVCALRGCSVRKICLHFIVSKLWILWNNNCIVIQFIICKNLAVNGFFGMDLVVS